MKKFINKNLVYILSCLMIVLHPFIELDYLFYDFLNNYGLPRLTTIINLIIYPLLILLTFILFEKNKKKVLIFSIIYGLIFLIYFYLHTKNAYIVQELIHLPNNYWYSIFDEFIYCLYLIIPLIYIWVFYRQEISDNALKNISFGISGLISIPIFISNIFIFGYSTYEGDVIDNIFSWFSLPFNPLDNHPRKYASKFFFAEGNTIGILMTIILPLMYYFFLREERKQKKIIYGLLIFIHSISMMILTTRVATYCAILIPLTILIVYVLFGLLKYEKINKLFLSFILIMIVITGTILPFSPAYQNQKIDAQTYSFQKESESQKDDKDIEEIRKRAESLTPYTKEWLDYYTYMFESYVWFLRVTPPIYYTELYDYKYDPQFWVDLMFDYELEERINGRQIQTIFTNYKWQQLNPYQKSLGMGYSTFMHGGIILERDFVRQYYALGLIGFILMMFAWLILYICIVYRFIRDFIKHKLDFLNILLLMSISIVLAASYLSGHTFDQLSVSMVISLMFGILLKRLSINE